MAERTCPVCKKRPVWRTNQSKNWRHLCKRITKPGLRISKPSAKHVVRPGTREIPPRPTCDAESMGMWRSPRHVGGSGDVSVRRRTLWSCGDGGVCAMQGSPAGGLSLTVCQGSTMGPGARGPSRRARRAARR